jgi:hypothetical protein
MAAPVARRLPSPGAQPEPIFDGGEQSPRSTDEMLAGPPVDGTQSSGAAPDGCGDGCCAGS